jgi:hypothetical protein
MSTKGLRIGHFEADGAIIHLPIGFIPDYFEMDKVSGGDAALHAVKWYRGMEQDEASGSREGWTDQEGTTDILADDAGITAYDTGAQAPTVEEWTQARGSAAVARGASVGLAGTFIKGTVGALNNVGQVTDREAIFECVVDGTSAATEPLWPSAIGETVVDGTTVWEMVNEAKFRKGYQGVTIAAALMSDSDDWYYRAFQSDNGNENHGDVVGWTDGIDQDWS